MSFYFSTRIFIFYIIYCFSTKHLTYIVHIIIIIYICLWIYDRHRTSVRSSDDDKVHNKIIFIIIYRYDSFHWAWPNFRVTFPPTRTVRFRCVSRKQMLLLFYSVLRMVHIGTWFIPMKYFGFDHIITVRLHYSH